MKTLTSRRLAPAVTSAALLATLATGCAGSNPATPAKDDKRAAEQLAAKPSGNPAATVLTEAQLKGALLTQAEAKSYKLMDNTGASVRPKTDTPRCRPLADITASGTNRTPEAAAGVSRSYNTTDGSGLSTTTALFSYEGEGAQQTVDEARKAVTDCAAGFMTTGNNGGATVKWGSVKAEQNAKAGDDSVSFVMTIEAQGVKLPMHYALVREDSTLAVFVAVNPSAPTTAKLPQDLFDSQTAKFAKHAGKATS